MTGRRAKTAKMAVLGQNNPLNGNFSEFFHSDSIDDTDGRFLLEFHADISRYNEM